VDEFSLTDDIQFFFHFVVRRGVKISQNNFVFMYRSVPDLGGAKGATARGIHIKRGTHTPPAKKFFFLHNM
jgi:hypothetical protein